MEPLNKTARPQKRLNTLIFCWTFALIMERICYDIVSITLCNVTLCKHLFPSRVAFIFGRDFVLMTGELNHSFSLFLHTPKTFNGVKSGLCGGQFMSENDSSCSCVLMLHSFKTRARWILALSSWNMPESSGKKKIHWWDNLVIQYIQELCWLAVT